MAAERRRTGVIVLLLLFCYAYFLPRWAEWNQNSRIDLTMALVEEGRFAIDSFYQNTGDFSEYGGHIYTDKAPGTSLAGVPAYAAFRLIERLPPVERLMVRAAHSSAFRETLREGGTGLLAEKIRFAAMLAFVVFFTINLPSALLGGLLYRFLAEIVADWRLRFALVLGYGVGSVVWPYSTVFYGHQLAAAMLFAAVVLARSVRRGRRSERWLWAAGALLGMTVLVEFTALPAVAMVVLYAGSGVDWRVRLGRWLRLGLAALPFALFLGYYNATCFGSPFSSGYKYLATFHVISEYGWSGFGLPRWEAVWGVTFSPYRGLFYLSPFFLLALPGWWAWWQAREWRAEFWLLGGMAAMQLLIVACWYDWMGGFAIGPRNLILTLPAWVVAVAFFLRRWGARPWARWLFAALVVLSLGMTGVAMTGGQLFPEVTIRRPWTEYWWPNFVQGDIARNWGMAVGLRRWWSLLPLPMAMALAWWVASAAPHFLPPRGKGGGEAASLR